MEYELFIFSIYDEEYTTKLFIDVAKDIVETDLKMENHDGTSIYVGCGLFSINVEIEDISDLEFIRNNYGVNINLGIDIQVYNKTFDKGITETMEVIGGVLKRIQGDILLLSNGSTQVLKREKGILSVNGDPDFSNYPFLKLGIPFEGKKLN